METHRGDIFIGRKNKDENNSMGYGLLFLLFIVILYADH